ncbi:sugar ABC transporter substrate-binding protein [Paraburkholderia phymatum]|uniref:Periplasmic binding protein/LacI transcriptional regulator n=1 Tax=Paraburkholderia phymatum (strain DSM 17167 / CIP 108236 / LMG 21445 / STM815) TaxID=391038 RepID=B2JTD1_PARP8|nr:sugar ABC transporter substrate-binding protein [Paraburkholderia phymatum]ACC75834.1 periplasmic binding protein/LacI transcriptional regulator [Paraburkholderia phymatum STM815]
MKKCFKKLGLIGLAGAMAFMTDVAAAKEITLGYVAAGMQYPFNVAAARGFEAAAKAAGVKTIVLDAKTSVEKQGNAVDDLIAQKVDGIAVLPIDAVVAQSWVERATSHNIPFVAVATQIGDPQKHAINDVYPKLTALVASDEVHVGTDAAQIAAKLLPKDRTAKIAIVEGAPGYPTVWQVTKGFKEGLDKAGVKYQIVASQPTDWTPEKGESVCQNILVAHPDVDLIFNQADDMVIGCARAVRAAGSHAKLVSRGGSKLGINAVKVGDVDGTVCIQPGKMGERAFKALYAAVTDPNAPKAKFIDVDTPQVTKATLSTCVPEW